MRMHRLREKDYILAYTDPVHGDFLPINNNENFARAVSTAKPLLRLCVQRKGLMYNHNTELYSFCYYLKITG